MEKQKHQTPGKKCAELLLNVLGTVAEKNATSLCRGFMHEPTIPKKLKK